MERVYLAAATERDRDSWIEKLHLASYECMKIQLESLREQLQARTGKDPIENPEPSVLPEYQPGKVAVLGEHVTLKDWSELIAAGYLFTAGESPVSGDPFLEMCVTCDGLPEVNGKGPDTFTSVHYMIPPQQQWVPHAHTEIVEVLTRPALYDFCSLKPGFELRSCVNIILNAAV